MLRLEYGIPVDLVDMVEALSPSTDRRGLLALHDQGLSTIEAILAAPTSTIAEAVGSDALARDLTEAAKTAMAAPTMTDDLELPQPPE